METVTCILGETFRLTFIWGLLTWYVSTRLTTPGWTLMYWWIPSVRTVYTAKTREATLSPDKHMHMALAVTFRSIQGSTHPQHTQPALFNYTEVFRLHVWYGIEGKFKLVIDYLFLLISTHLLFGPWTKVGENSQHVTPRSWASSSKRRHLPWPYWPSHILMSPAGLPEAR